MKLKNIAYAGLVLVATTAFVLGSAGVSEAKGKKKVAGPPPQKAFCFALYKPVCAVKGGMKFTYANACYAHADGAKVVSQKACKPSKAMKGGKKAGKKAMKKAGKKKMKK
ncbi:MAG: hypothetical protein ABI830_01310 [Pseudolabrys sp.]